MRRLFLLMTAMGAAVLVASGVAYALAVQCDGTNDQDPDPGQCRGTDQNDVITGTAQRDLIFALGGFDQVNALGGQDELNGGSSNDDLYGGIANDRYNGGGGSDFLSEFQGATDASNDVMNGGGNDDWIEGNLGNDIIKGQEGNDRDEGFFYPLLFGGGGDDELYGGPGEDGLEGEAGTDKHFGGRDNDFIDAVADDTDPVTGDPLGTHDVVDCGSGFDRAVFNSDEDIVSANCEDRVDVAVTTTVAPPTSGTTDDAVQQQQREAFLQENGLQP